MDAMVANRNREASDGDRGQDWPHLVSFGTLLASVVGVLVLGAVLRTETPGAVEAGLTTLASSGPVASDPPRPPAAAASLDRLARSPGSLDDESTSAEVRRWQVKEFSASLRGAIEVL